MWGRGGGGRGETGCTFVPCHFALGTVHNIYWQWHVRNGNETQQHSAPVRPSHHVPTMRTDRLRILSCAWRGNAKNTRNTTVPECLCYTRIEKAPRSGGALLMSNLAARASPRNRPGPSAVMQWCRGHTGKVGMRALFGGGWYTWPTDSCSNKDAGRRDCKTPTPCNELQAGHERVKRECKGSLCWRSVVWLTGHLFHCVFFVSVRACIWIKHSQAPFQPHSSKVRHL